MSTLFQPIGELSRREMVLAALADRPEGDTIGYDELAEILGTDDRRTCQGAIDAAKPALGKLHNKALVAVRGIGYRVIHAGEHLALARQHQRKSLRQLGKSRAAVTHVDYSKLTEGERAAITLAATSIGMQVDYMRRNDIRASRIEAAVETVQTTQERSAEEIAQLTERLARVEGRLNTAVVK